MLKFTYFSQPDHQRLLDLLPDLNLSKVDVTFVVSDLHSKKDLKTRLLSQMKFIEGHQVLRASELWQQVLFRVRPDLNVISKSLAIVKTKEFLKTTGTSLGLGVNQASMLVQAACELIPILLHPEGDERIKIWFEENPDRKLVWQLWYVRARILVQEFLRENIILGEWIPSFLVQSELTQNSWKRPLVLDLAGSLSSAEVELLSLMSRFHQIMIVVPSPEMKSRFPQLMQPYEQVTLGDVTPKSLTEQKFTKNLKQEFLRFNNSLAEVKYVVAKVRSLLDSGVPLEKVQIVVSDLEAYADCLREHLLVEGIPIAETKNQILREQVGFQKLWSRWLLCQKQFEKNTLQLNLPERTLAIRSDRLTALSPENMVKTGSAINVRIDPELVASESMPLKTTSAREFLEILVALGEGQNISQDCFDLIAETLLALPNQIALSLEFWGDFLWELASRDLGAETSKGQKSLRIVDIFGSIGSLSDYRFFIGLSDSHVRGSQSGFLDDDDIFVLQKDLGFNFDAGRSERMEFALEWAAQAVGIKDEFLTSDCDFVGNVQMPCRYWIQSRLSCLTNETKNELFHQTPAPLTRWDELMFKHARGEKTAIRISKGTAVGLSWPQMPSLSQSSLKTWDQCQFKFYAEKFFQLESINEFDFDLDRMNKGSLIHHLLAQMSLQTREWSHTDLSLCKIADSWRATLPNGTVSELTWDADRTRAIQQALRVQSVHNEFVAQLPSLEILGTEVAFELFLNPDTGDFLSDKNRSRNCVRVSGSIDRVDQYVDPETGEIRLVVWDYKGSITADMKKSPEAWLENGERQLLMYAWAIAKSGVRDSALAVKFLEARFAGVHYWSYQEDSRGYGVSVDGGAGASLMGLSKATSWTEDHLREQFLKLEKSLHADLTQILDGHFDATPKDRSLCFSCLWRSLCRANHLK